MKNKELDFWFWVIKHLVPNKVVYLCYMRVIAVGTTEKYSNKTPEEIQWNEYADYFCEKYGIE